ncbi:MAG TPA: hypothetical protein VE988_17475 [Gemmataceae bacterium]|nr:hypothetical protein [Gemmataceae bacterium]
MKAPLIATAELAVILSACFGLYLHLNRPTFGSHYGRTMLDVKSLDQAVTAYWLLQKELPPSLEVLAERFPDGRPALIKDKEALHDAWGRPYHYDRDQLDPKSDKPLIWSDGDPRTRGVKIANWGEEPRPYTSIGTARVVTAGVICIVVLVIGWFVFQWIERLPAEAKNSIWLALTLFTVCGFLLGFFYWLNYVTMLD